MNVTERDRAVLIAVARYYTLTRQQIGQLCFPSDKDGRITRARLQKLLEAGLLNRTRMEVVNPSMGAPAPVYYPSDRGVRFLAQELEDSRFLSVPTQNPNWQHLYHWVAIAQSHILLDACAAKHPDVKVEEWLGEWSVANPDESLPEKRFRLYTLLQENPRLVCAPDAAFLLSKDGFRKVFYLEQDRDTTREAQRVAAQKASGYAALAARNGHVRHFPTTNVEKFTVVMIAPSPKRRQALLKAVAEKPGADLWRFASQTDLNADTFLTAPAFFKCTGEATSLVRSGEGGAS